MTRSCPVGPGRCRCPPAPAGGETAARLVSAGEGGRWGEENITGSDGKKPVFSWHFVTDISAIRLENGIP